MVRSRLDELRMFSKITRTEVLKFRESVSLYEGLEFETFEEARLTYAKRKDLPASAFCGPDRSYPAYDVKRIRAGLQRLSQFGGKLPKATRAKIYRCLRGRAKKKGVEHDAKNYKWKSDGSPNPKYRKKIQEAVVWFEKKKAHLFKKECNTC